MKQTELTDIVLSHEQEPPTLAIPTDDVMTPRAASWCAVLVVSAALAWLAPAFATRSLSLDGLVYASIASLLMAGDGSFWSLPYFEAQITRFIEHPPLAIYLQSKWMAVTGTDFWSEKLFSLAFLLGSCAALARLLRAEPHRVWIALAVFAGMPVVLDTLANNHLEAPLTLICLLAVLAGRQAMARPAWAIALGALVFTGFLTKGPVALFPLAAVPLADAWLNRRLKRPLVVGAIATAVFASAGLMTLTWADAGRMLEDYWREQVVASVLATRPVEHTRLDLLLDMARNLGIGAIIAIVLGAPRMRRQSVYWLIIALSATLPLLLSARSHPHYLVPGLPFFAAAFASAVEPRRWPPRLLALVPAAAGFTLSVAILLVGVNWRSPGRHSEDIADADAIAGHVAGARVVAHCDNRKSLKPRAYLFRHHGIKTRLLPEPIAINVPRTERKWLICDRAGEAYEPVARLHDGLILWQWSGA